MQPISNALRAKIKMTIKNRIDISNLIEDKDIRGEDLTGAIIETFNRPDGDISNCIFTRAIIGKEGGVTNLNRVRAVSCNFKGLTLKGKVWARRGNFRGTNFDEAFAPYVDYRYADFRGCTFCDTVFTIGTKKAYGSRFDNKFFQDLAKSWNLEIKVKEVDFNASNI